MLAVSIAEQFLYGCSNIPRFGYLCLIFINKCLFIFRYLNKFPFIFRYTMDILRSLVTISLELGVILSSRF